MPVDQERLARVPLFASMTDEQRHSVAARLEERTVEPGTHLTTEGGGGYFFFVIDEGTATVTRDGQDIAELGPGDFFGEASILATPRRTATVTAASPMRVFELFGADFAKLTQDIPEMGATVRAALEAHLPH
jgi:CRP/FNR family transcriptional regulator, cyclic AMP receptor protein